MKAIPLWANEEENMSRDTVAAQTIFSAKLPSEHAISLSRTLIWTRQVRSAATDGVYLYFNPDYWATLTDSQKSFLLGHEVCHIVPDHVMRGKIYAGRGFIADVPFVWKLWNLVTDAIINAYLIAAGLEPIKGCILIEGVTGDDIAEEVYVREWQKQEDAEEPSDDAKVNPSDESGEAGESEGEGEAADDSGESDQDGEPSDSGDSGESNGDGDDSGSGSDEDGESGEAGDDQGGESSGSGTATDESTGEGQPQPTDHDGHDDHFEPRYEGTPEDIERQQQEDADELQRQIDREVDQAKSENRLPGKGFDSEAYGGGRSDPLGVDWRDELAAYLNETAREGVNDWGHIHRRRFSLLGVVTPSKKGSLERLVTIKDISSSVDSDSLDTFDAELADLIDQLSPSQGSLVLHTNTQVVHDDEVFSGDEYLSMKKWRGGGTYMSAGLDWLEEHGEDPDVILVFTDAGVYDEDLARLAEAGALLVLDSYSSYVWAKRRIEESGIDFIVVNDSPA
jgi:predicted metal-dependent peptidase